MQIRCSHYDSGLYSVLVNNKFIEDCKNNNLFCTLMYYVLIINVAVSLIITEHTNIVPCTM